ncbi:1-acyl-sn-glycerol-3-phosphate acyltransferase [Thiotrichales bacterium 19S9-12]|nr:1-acyl-sn-glycerol-3-phosphate acyltransferase [Thiotrichales bacterium 19S9-11]MCF6810803.1 1-acyl-sn-glycerol-3-phosphate acyltransferase [Thiotrichales bacterium 19S9-12]
MKLLAWTNYIWRLFATGFCFSMFGVGAILLAYCWIPMIHLLSSEMKKKDHVQYAIYLNFRFFVWLMESLGLAKFSIEGDEKLLKDRGTLLIANHPSLVDYVVITSQLKSCDNVVKASLWDNFFVKHVIQSAGYIPNKESQETFDRIKESLYSGNNLLLFPEGTRSVINQPIRLKRGAAQIAIRLKVPIRLIYITCNPRTLTKELKWYQIPNKRVNFKVVVGECIVVDKFLEEAGQLPSLAARRLTRYIEKKLTEGGQYECI